MHEWHGRLGVINVGKEERELQVQCCAGSEHRFVGAPSNASIAAYLARELNVSYDSGVKALELCGAGGRWNVVLDNVRLDTRMNATTRR